jgi:DNA-binding CsgD family transcriptional regulator/antitoxin (DNA-binding transcriptional repressor) of toxin-antitoxin stability system
VTSFLAGGPEEDVFVGREAELARLADVIARVRQGESWLVTIEGESGVGKTALARRSLASSAGLTAFWARADPSEADLGYGIVEQLLRGVDRRVLARYPFLAGDVVKSSPFAVGAQLLGVIGDQQADGPVALVIDDVQWADRRSVEALSFMFRRLSVDAVVVILVIRGDRDQLDEPARRMLLSMAQRRRISLSGLTVDDVASLAAALGARPLSSDAIGRLHDRTGGHTLYVQTVLSDAESLERLGRETAAVPASLAAAIGDQLAVLSAPTRSLLEMLAVVNGRMPLALLSAAAGVEEPSAAIEPAVRAGLADLSSDEPSRPVAIRHRLQRDAIYAGTTAERRRELHARAVTLVDEVSAWAHRVASLDRPDEGLATQLERLADDEAASGRLALAATHLRWASDVSPDRAGRERRLLTAALHLMLAEETRGLALRQAVEASGPSPLRSCVLGTMAFSSGQLAEAEQRFSEALAQARIDPDSQPLAAIIANRLAGTYTLLGDGEKVKTFGRWALGTGCLDAAAASQTRTLISIAASQVAGPRDALAELGHLDADPARVDLVDVDGLSFRGVFRLLDGDLGHAVTDMTASLRMVRKGATMTLGLRSYSYLALAQYLVGAWDDVLLTSEQGFSAAAIHSRRYELPLLHLAAGCVLAGRGAAGEAERHARLAEEAAASLDYGQERLYAAMARALVCQASGDYLGMADALGYWRDDSALDNRSRMYAALWRPLLAEGLVGSGQSEQAAAVLEQMRAESSQVGYLQPALAWLEGWLAELQGTPEEARRIYQRGEDTAGTESPVYTARLLLAHGRLLRRTGQRRQAVERLRRANDLYLALRAAPFIARTDEELTACGLRQEPAMRRSALEMTGRETEVAHLIEQGMTNAEIAAELFITPKAVEYHLGNIYAKFGLKGRQQLRRLLSDTRRPAPA